MNACDSQYEMAREVESLKVQLAYAATRVAEAERKTSALTQVIEIKERSIKSKDKAYEKVCDLFSRTQRERDEAREQVRVLRKTLMSLRKKALQAMGTIPRATYSSEIYEACQDALAVTEQKKLDNPG